MIDQMTKMNGWILRSR